MKVPFHVGGIQTHPYKAVEEVYIHYEGSFSCVSEMFLPFPYDF